MHCTYRDFLMRANYAHPTYPKHGILSWGVGNLYKALPREVLGHAPQGIL